MTNPMSVGEPELLVVGGLTIDRLPDGRELAGGSVLHATRAMALDGRRIAVRTIAGPEDDARAGLDEIAQSADLTTQAVARSIRFEHQHEHEPASRRLRYGGGGGTLEIGARVSTPALLLAPVADELAAASLGAAVGAAKDHGAIVAANLQGWLRRLEPGTMVEPIPLAEVAHETLRVLAACDALIASREDLVSEGRQVTTQVEALRTAMGRRPLIVVTDGSNGAWLDDATGLHHVAVPRVVRHGSDVGAGDAFAALFAGALGRGVAPIPAALDAAAVTAEYLAERTGRRVRIVGDVHGMLRELRTLLASAWIIDGRDRRWIAGHDELWLTGDLVDRGPDGIGVIELIRDLADDAEAQGGRVGSVVGNHELQLMAARLLPDAPTGRPGGTSMGDWLANGGRRSDLERLDEGHLGLIRGLPAMVRVGTALLVHADAPFYLDLGDSVSEVNAALAGALAVPDAERWDQLLGAFSERRAMWRDPSLVATFLRRFGGRQLVHGHTQLPLLTGDRRVDLRHEVAYADARCVAVDGALCSGGPGFLYVLPSG